MRRHRYTGTIPLLVAAAHSRAVAPGEEVDFDEVIRPAQGLAYSLETAIGPYVSLFEPAPDERLDTDPDGNVSDDHDTGVVVGDQTPADDAQTVDDSEEPTLWDDGPTLEEYVAAGYAEANYPPHGYAEKPSGGLDAYVAELAAIVAGNADDAVTAIQSIEARKALSRLNQLETNGKKRVSVLRAIAERDEELAQ